MRTTLTLSDDIDVRLRKIAHEQNRSYKEVVNEVLRRGLDRLETAEPQPDYQVRTRNYGFQPGIDRDKLNQLYDELEGSD